MSYATQTDLEDAFGAAEIAEIADRDRDGEIDAPALAAVLVRADAFIDSYLGALYAVPVAPPPPVVLVAVACDLARYWLYDDAAPERVRQAYEDAVAWLKAVAAGDVFLGLPQTAQPLAGSALGRADARVFSRELTGGF